MLTWTDKKPFESLDDILNNGGATCGGLSSVYISILRNNGIPARFMTGGTVHESGIFGGHVWTEFYLENYGWIPVDPSAFTSTGYFFGFMSNCYVSNHVSEIISEINAVRNNKNLEPLQELSEINEVAFEILFNKLKGNTEPNLISELKKKGIRIYWYSVYHWVFTIYDLDVLEELIELCGDAVFDEKYNSIGAGYIYSEEHDGNYYYIIFVTI